MLGRGLGEGVQLVAERGREEVVAGGTPLPELDEHGSGVFKGLADEPEIPAEVGVQVGIVERGGRRGRTNR